MIEILRDQVAQLVRALLVCLLALACVQPASGALAQELEAVELPSGNNHAQPFDRMRFLLDESGTFDAQAALDRRAEFQTVASRWLDFGASEATVWLLVRASNPGDRDGTWMLDIQRPFADELYVAKLSEGAPDEVLLSATDHSHFDERPVISQYLVAPLPMSAGETSDILIGMRSSTGSWMPVTFATEERMRTAHMQEARFNWLINGAIAALVLAALAMGRLIGWGTALPFAAYASAGALFVANNEGYLHRFIWPADPWLYQPANVILLPLLVAAGLQFARRFTGSAEAFPRLDRALLVFQWVTIAMAVAALWLWPQGWFQTLVYLAAPLGALAYLVIGALGLRRKALGGVPFFIGTLAVALTVSFMAAVMAFPGRYALTVALDYLHATLLIETLAFFIAIVVRALAIQRDLNTSLAAEVALTQEKLALSEQLQASRERYDQARSHAESMRTRLASTSHDLQQPLLSLRQGLQKMADEDPEATGKIASALDYLESVTASGLDASAPANDEAGEKPDEGHEHFPLAIVFDNCAAMFADEASKRGVTLKIEPCAHMVRTDPVGLIRALSNLVSNALKHAQASAITIQSEADGDTITISVSDDGKGMGEDELARLTTAYEKGSDSEGHGLGLALVSEFAAQPGHALAIRSQPGTGSTFELSLPKGEGG